MEKRKKTAGFKYTTLMSYVMMCLMTAAVGLAGTGQNCLAAEVEAAVSAERKVKAAVYDIISGEPLIGAGVLIRNTATGAVTDLDGACELDLGNGEHVLTVSYIGYKPATVAVNVSRNGVSATNAGNPDEDGSFVSVENGIVRISIASDERVLDNAVVTARKNLESLQALQNERISSGFAIENMGAKEMSIKGISNAQESVASLLSADSGTDTAPLLSTVSR